MAKPDYILDIEGLADPNADAPGQSNDGASSISDSDSGNEISLSGRPWLAVRWRCCGAYSRVYRDRSAKAYEGRCPRCLKHVRVAVGPGGTSNRFFEVR